MLKPLGDRVVVQFEEKEETVGGFVLAGNSKSSTKTAQVLAVSEGVRSLNGDLVPSHLTVGDRVLLENTSGLEVKDEDKTVHIVRESDVLAILQ